MRLIAFALSLFVLSASAAESDWNTSWDGWLYGYANRSSLRADSILNPNNQIAGLPQRTDVAELRLNFKAENDTVRLTAQPIALVREMHNVFGTQQRSEGYFSQWQARVQIAENWNIAAGRDVLNWGAAQFRSPSSPFYFDNGRNDPLRELVGMDELKVSWTPDMHSSLNLARIVRSGYGMAAPDQWRDSWLAKLDQRGDAWAYGLVAVKSPDLPVFLGAHAQQTLSEALMVYAEMGSSAQRSALQSSPNVAQPFIVQAPASRSITTLVGAAYTFENGQSLATEYLHEAGGYNSVEENAYFQRATTQPAMALGLAPRLLGQDYLHLVWQSNMMGSEMGYWRLMYTRSLTDDGNELAGYAEAAISARVSLYGLAVLPVGNNRQEFSALLQRNITVGVKIALP